MKTKLADGTLIACAPIYAQDGDGTLVTLAYRRQSAAGSSTLLGTLNLRFNIHLPPASPLGDAALAQGLIVAMAAATPLQVEAPVSARLLQLSARYQEIHRAFFPDETIVPVQAPVAASAPPDPSRGVGAFLSNGIDSWHAILKHRQEITHYIFILGFDVWLKHHAYAARAVTLARETAAKLGKPLIIVETNSFDFAHHFIPWPRDGHPLQAAIGFLLSPLLSKIIIAADLPWQGLITGSEHPHLYEALRSDTFELQHSGSASTRQEKVRGLCRQPEWLPYLRVCWDMPEDRLNCGRCEKCLRTMVGLTIEGQLSQCPVLPPLDIELLKKLEYKATMSLFYEEFLEAATSRKDLPPDFVSALRQCVERNRMNALVEQLKPYRKHLVQSLPYQQQEKKLRDRLFALFWESDSNWILKKLRRHSADYRQDLAKHLRKIAKHDLQRVQWRSRWKKFRALFHAGWWQRRNADRRTDHPL